jgi:hypothetical protein
LTTFKLPQFSHIKLKNPTPIWVNYSIPLNDHQLQQLLSSFLLKIEAIKKISISSKALKKAEKSEMKTKKFSCSYHLPSAATAAAAAREWRVFGTLSHNYH